MKFSAKSMLALLLALTATQSDAFTTQHQQRSTTAFGLRSASLPTLTKPFYATNEYVQTNTFQLQATTPETTPSASTSSSSSSDEASEEVQRLKAMAQKLRTEAANLEAQQANQRAKATERAFQQFDTNNDGEVTLDELKSALERTFQMELPDDRVKTLMSEFDKSGDGRLQKDEFVGVEQFRSRLEYLAAEEKRKALEATKNAQKEAEVSRAIESQLALINDKEPTGTDKIVSVLPYLFPLMDSILFGQYLFQGNENNPVVTGLAILYGIYRSIPLSGFLAFFGLSALSGNLSINRLIRFNMQQAIFLDVALFVPGVIGALTAAASSGLGLQLPAGVGEIGSDAVFLTVLATIAYSTVSSLLGKTPDQVPLISKAVNNRLPSIDASLFDSEGRFDPSKFAEKNKSNDEEKKD